MLDGTTERKLKEHSKMWINPCKPAPDSPIPDLGIEGCSKIL